MASLPGRAETGLVRHTHTHADARGAHTPSSQPSGDPRQPSDWPSSGRSENATIRAAPSHQNEQSLGGGEHQHSKQLIQAGT